jgi:hypothetical protein
MKTYGRVEAQLHTFLTSAHYMEVNGQLQPLVPFDRRLGESQSQSGCGGKEDKPFFAPSGNRTSLYI